MRRALLVGILAAAMPAAGAPAASAKSASHACATPDSFMVGPFIGYRVRARSVSCHFARKLAKRWGRTQSCVSPSSPSDHTCAIGRYRCTYRSIPAAEGGKVTCKRRKSSRAASFHFGS